VKITGALFPTYAIFTTYYPYLEAVLASTNYRGYRKPSQDLYVEPRFYEKYVEN
jgi:hypothetical protein